MVVAELPDLRVGLHQLDTTRLTSATRVNLGFNYPRVTADFFCCGKNVIRSVARYAVRDWQAVLAE